MIENKLNELNIFALRDLARKTGVSSPTSKKKEDLIKEIIEIMSGEKQPSQSKTKQGRPPKVFGYDVANVFKNSLSGSGESLGYKRFNQEAVEYQDSDITTVSGWLELVNNNSALLWVENNLQMETYFISSKLLSNYEVKMGDKVVAEIVVNENQKLIKDIFSINDCPILKLPKKRNNYENVANKIPNQKINFNSIEYSNLNLQHGENIFIYGRNNNDNTMAVVDLLNDSKIDTKLYVNISLAGKNKIYLSNLKHTENFVANIMDETDVAKRVVSLAIERAKRSFETGENVLIVVDDMTSVLGVERDGLKLIKSLATLAKESKNGSITLIAVMPEKNLNQIEKLADKRLHVENKNLIVAL